MTFLYSIKGHSDYNFSDEKVCKKSYCSRIQDYLKNQKMAMGRIITFSMLLLLVRMSNNKYIELFSRTEGHL